MCAMMYIDIESKTLFLIERIWWKNIYCFIRNGSVFYFYFYFLVIDPKVFMLYICIQSLELSKLNYQ